MQSSKTVESEEEDKIDFESFAEANEEASLTDSYGLARLKSCDIRNDPSDLPSDYRNKYSSFNYDKYFVFKAEMRGSDDNQINVILPAEKGHKEIDVVHGWTGSADITELAGSVVPVTHRAGDCYRIEDFDGLISGMLSINSVSSLVDKGFYEYSNGNWRLNKKVISSITLMTFGFLTGLSGYYVAFSGTGSLLGTVILGIATISLMYARIKRR